MNAAWGTKGKTNLSIRYKKYGEKNISFKLSHSKANLHPFYGYNGYQTYYNEAFENPSSTEYITSAFYNYRQEKTQFQFQIQDQIARSKFNWQVGIDIGYYRMNRVDFEGLNKNIEEAYMVVDAPTLFDRYIDWNFIDENEKNGGWANSIHSSLLYDSRDRLTNPMKGIWSQAIFKYSPSAFGNPYSGLQVAVKHHQFITLLPNRVSFAYRLRYDATFGNLAFYNRPVLADGIEGYGGATGMVGEGFGTLWGVHQNRVVGKQMALSNFELRIKLIRFRMFNQNWHTAIVPLFSLITFNL